MFISQQSLLDTLLVEICQLFNLSAQYEFMQGGNNDHVGATPPPVNGR